MIDWSSDGCSSALAAHFSQHTGGIIFVFTGHGGCYRRSNDVPPAPKRPKRALAPPLADDGRAGWRRNTSGSDQASAARLRHHISALHPAHKQTPLVIRSRPRNRPAAEASSAAGRQEERRVGKE